jgi:DNA-binding MarR family transcriptional regulator
MRTNAVVSRVDPDHAVDQLGDAVLALLRSWRALTHRAAEAGAPSTMAVLELVRLLGDDERRLSEIAVLRGVDQSVVSRQITELQAKGMVCRRPDPADRRASLIRLTPAGHELLGRLGELRRDWLHGALARLPDTDVLAAARLVGAVAEEIAERALEPTGSPPPPAAPDRPAMISARGTTE